MELDVTNTARNNPSLFYISNCQIVKFCIKLTEFNVTNIACNNPSQFYIQNRQIVKLCINPVTKISYFSLNILCIQRLKVEILTIIYNFSNVTISTLVWSI
jgi:hypothetical protein